MPNRKDGPDWQDFDGYDPYASGELGDDEHVEIPPLPEAEGSSRTNKLAAAAVVGLLAAAVTAGAVRAKKRRKDNEAEE